MPSAMLLSAGLGTRLRPLTDECPKPLVPVGDRAALAHVLGQLEGGASAQTAFESIVVNTHHLAEHFKSQISSLNSKLHLIHEVELLGTAGGLAGARRWLASPVLIWNGDSLTKPPVGALLDSATRSGGLTLAVERLAAGAGNVGMDAEGRVVRLRGERFGVETCGGNYIGVGSLGAAGLAELPSRGCLIGDYALPNLRRGQAVLCVPASVPWFDIGSVPGYAAANKSWLSERSRELGPSGCFVDASARVGPGVRLEASIVGAGGEVSGSGLVSGCIIWPRAKVRAPLANAVVTPLGRVVPLVDV